LNLFRMASGMRK